MSSFSNRVAAYMIDCALLFLVLAPLGIGASLLTGFSAGDPLAIWVGIVVNFSLPSWSYFVLSDAYFGGRTIGKRAMHLGVVPVGVHRIGLGRALARTAIKLFPWELSHVALVAGLAAPDSPILSILIGISFVGAGANLVIAYRTDGGSSIHDRAVSTRVTKRGEQPSIGGPRGLSV